MKPIIGRNEKGNTTHSRWGDGTERWFDADGHITKWKDKNGTLHTNAGAMVKNVRYKHGAEIPKSKTNWDKYQERRNVAKLSLERGIEIFKEHDIPCIFCPAREWCNTAANCFISCTETFAAWARTEVDQ